MKKSREMKIVLSSLVVLFLLSFASVYMFFNRGKEESILGVQDNIIDNNEEVEGSYTKGIPYILSQPPISVSVGELYVYVPRVVDIDSDGSELKLELIDSPEWLYIINGVVQGVPEVSGPISFTLRVSDGYNSSQEKSYIIVEDRDE